MDEIAVTDQHDEAVVSFLQDRIIEFNSPPLVSMTADLSPEWSRTKPARSGLGYEVVGQVDGTPLGHGVVFFSTVLGES